MLEDLKKMVSVLGFAKVAVLLQYRDTHALKQWLSGRKRIPFSKHAKVRALLKRKGYYTNED